MFKLLYVENIYSELSSEHIYTIYEFKGGHERAALASSFLQRFYEKFEFCVLYAI